MKAFAALYAELDATTSTRRKVAAMSRYFVLASADDAAWAAYFLAGARPRRLVPTRVLRETACRVAGMPDWLFEESYQAVGDLAETIALLLPPPTFVDEAGLARWLRERLLPLRGAAPEVVEAALMQAWLRLSAHERFVLNKLLTGGFRVGVSRQLVLRGLAQAFGIDEKRLAHRFVGYTDGTREPDSRAFQALIRADDPKHSPEYHPGHDPEYEAAAALERAAQPYPFFLAQPLPGEPAVLGERSDWLAEWKWDGIRAQLVRRAGGAWIWSRGEDLVTEQFPEIVEAASRLPEGSVIDGELLCWDEAAGRPLPFAVLQRRIGRLRPSSSLLREAPAVMLAYDLLELGGQDLRGREQDERRALLEGLLAGTPLTSTPDALRLSPLVQAADWTDLAELRSTARARGVEGLMLKRCASAYGIGRTKSVALGDWWKWKLDPLTVDCVLVYAQRGHGRRASLYSDYTFAVWSAGREAPDRTLVTFAKAYSGLTDAEIAAVDAVIRRSTLEKFGPVRSVTPSMVFELGFEGIQRSARHRSGVAVRFPRILRRRPDKPIEEADTLHTLNALLESVIPGNGAAADETPAACVPQIGADIKGARRPG